MAGETKFGVGGVGSLVHLDQQLTAWRRAREPHNFTLLMPIPNPHFDENKVERLIRPSFIPAT